MNANRSNNQRSQNLSRSRITYKGSVLDPGGRTGKTRQNWIKRQKNRIRASNASSGSIQNVSGNSGGQTSQSQTRAARRNVNNRSTGSRSTAQTDLRIGGGTSVANKIGVAHLGTYLGAVLDPFDAPHGARVPSEVPFPSATVTMTFTGLVTPNASGNFMLMLQPQGGTIGWTEFVIVQAGAAFNAGTGFMSDVDPVGIGLRTNYLPAGMALKYRTVGAAIKCFYVGKENDRAGYYGCAFLPKAATREVNGAIRRGYTEDQLREAQYSLICSNKTIPEVLYVPRDDIDFDYMNADVVRESSVAVIEGFGLPNTPCIKWEAVIHAEFIPDPTAVNAKLLSTSVSLANKGDASTILGGLTAAAPGYIVSPDSGKGLFDDFSNSVSDILGDSLHFVTNTAKGYVADFFKEGVSEIMSGNFESLSELASLF